METLANMMYICIHNITHIHASVQYIHTVSRDVRQHCNKLMIILCFIQLEEAGIAGSNGTFQVITCISNVK